jgi:hypothetical protein
MGLGGTCFEFCEEDSWAFLKAGLAASNWVPACAGMTVGEAGMTGGGGDDGGRGKDDEKGEYPLKQFSPGS